MLRYQIAILILFVIGVTTGQVTDESTYGKVITNIYRIFKSCADTENITMGYCMKEKIVIGLDAITKSRRVINLIPNSLSLVKNEDILIDDQIGKYLLEIKERPENRSIIVNNLVMETFLKFIESRCINIKIPISALSISSDDAISGRGKKDKNGGILMMGAWMVGTAIAMKMAALAAISGKALITSILAFALAAVAALKKHSGDSHGHASTYEVINVPAGGHHGRSVIAASGSTQQVNTDRFYYKPADDDFSYQNKNILD